MLRRQLRAVNPEGWVTKQFGSCCIPSGECPCVKNGVLTVVLKEEEAAEIARRASEAADYELTIDLENWTVQDRSGLNATFQIDDFTRHCLLEGLDDIGLTLQHEAEIAKYEATHPVPAAWRS